MRLAHLASLIFTLLLVPASWAANPFLTDDPVPVELHHAEFYLATLDQKLAGNWLGTAPHVEINYGALPNLEMHLVAPMVFTKPRDESAHYGYGDTELSLKYQLLKEGSFWPFLAIVPTVELPTGNHTLGFGNGKAQVFLPVSIQKSFGDWVSYAEAGRWLNSGDKDSRNYWFAGLEIQHPVTKTLALGVEIYHKTSVTRDIGSQTDMNLGAIWDLSDTYHVLVSAGHSVQGPASVQGYLAFEITLGPEKKASAK